MPRFKKKTTNKNHNSSNEDYVQLKKALDDSHSLDPNSYKSLCKPRDVHCEFCEKVTKNRFYNILHTASHIIIPLINYTVYQCEICLYYFISTEDLAQHQYKKHSLIDLVADTDIDNFSKPQNDIYKSELNTAVKNIKLEQTHTKHITNELSHIKYIKNDYQKFPIEGRYEKFKDIKLENLEQEGSLKNDEGIHLKNELVEGRSLKSRLMFEEDVVINNCDQLFNDLTVSCQVKKELFPPISMQYKTSVHYEQLLSPGVYKCRKCFNMFSNRYDMILHETKHLVITNSQVIFCDICNKFILGGITKLKHHKLSHNNTFQSQKSVLDISRKQKGGDVIQNGGNIGLNGANLFCQKGDDVTTTMKMCSVCYSFCKNTPHVKYYYVDELSELGKKFKCQKCGYKFFYINLIKKLSKRGVCKKRNKNINKSLTNEDRLKQISNRFKMMKKLYYVVLFFPCKTVVDCIVHF